MRILTLNCLGGRKFIPLMRFVETYAHKVDVWCLQEMPLGTEVEESSGIRHNLLYEFLAVLPNVSAFAYPSPINEFRGNRLRHNTSVGIATLVHHGLKPKLAARTALYGALSEHATAHPNRTGTGHFLAVESNDEYGNKILIGNVHGLWTPRGKEDVPDRLEQSCRLASFVREQRLPVILTGDFNLELNSRSTMILEETPMRNLVREYMISTTRTSLYAGTSLHADNAFVTAQVHVSDFRVLPDVVSDHAALLLEARL